MPATAIFFLSEEEKSAREAILQLMTDFGQMQIDAFPVGSGALLELGLDRTVHLLMMAARAPLEQRLSAQEQQINDLKAAVEALKVPG